MSLDRVVARLQDLGLNQLEAEVYSFLISNRPMTAYRIAKLLGRPTANTYKAIEALARRGAVLVEEGENRLCRAVPAAEFLRHMEKGFLDFTRQAAEELSQLEQQSEDERVYRLESLPLLWRRCEEMLDRCERIAVVDAFPRTLANIQLAIERAASRGVDVYVQAYSPVQLAGIKRLAVVDIGSQSVEQWKSQQLNVVVDGRECLVALVSQNLDEIYQAIWSNSLYLSCLLHAGMLAEHSLHRLRAAANSPDQMSAMLAEHPFFINTNVPGQRELLARYLTEKLDGKE